MLSSNKATGLPGAHRRSKQTISKTIARLFMGASVLGMPKCSAYAGGIISKQRKFSKSAHGHSLALHT
jgi:hypothetical protein